MPTLDEFIEVGIGKPHSGLLRAAPDIDVTQLPVPNEGLELLRGDVEPEGSLGERAELLLVFVLGHMGQTSAAGLSPVP